MKKSALVESREYSYVAKQDAKRIIVEVIDKGFSDGWLSNKADYVDELSILLEPFNVYYVDDMFGEWKRINKR